MLSIMASMMRVKPMTTANRMMLVAMAEFMTSMGFSSRPNSALYMGSSTCSKPNTDPYTRPKTAEESRRAAGCADGHLLEMPHGPADDGHQDPLA